MIQIVHFTFYSIHTQQKSDVVERKVTRVTSSWVLMRLINDWNEFRLVVKCDQMVQNRPWLYMWFVRWWDSISLTSRYSRKVSSIEHDPKVRIIDFWDGALTWTNRNFIFSSFILFTLQWKHNLYNKMFRVFFMATIISDDLMWNILSTRTLCPFKSKQELKKFYFRRFSFLVCLMIPMRFCQKLVQLTASPLVLKCLLDRVSSFDMLFKNLSFSQVRFRLLIGQNSTFLILWNLLRWCNDNCNGCSRIDSVIAASRSKNCWKSCLCGLCNEQKTSWTSRISRESRINTSYSYGSKCGRFLTIILFLKYDFLWVGGKSYDNFFMSRTHTIFWKFFI